MKEEIKKLRAKLQLSQTELAETLGVTRSAICRWELGTNPPQGKYIRKLRELAGIDNALKEQIEQIERKAENVAKYAENKPLQGFALEILQDINSLKVCLKKRI